MDLLREFGPALGGALLVIAALAGAVVRQDRRIAARYESEIKRLEAENLELKAERRELLDLALSGTRGLEHATQALKSERTRR